MQTALTDANVSDHLRRHGLLGAGEEAVPEPAGDGNINWVRRLRLPASGRSWIVKQARPALERFPEYRASTERIVFEARYYEVVEPFDGEGICPQVLHFDEDQRVLVLEDLGGAERLDHALARGADVGPASVRLAGFLGRVHAGTRGREAELVPRFGNGEMQRLHGDHIFQLPFRENDFPLTPAVAERARGIGSDSALVAAADAAYARYLEPRGALVHADVQAGNVLLTDRGPVLLDAEIAHVGDPAFDVGTLFAHCLFPSAAAGEAHGAAPALERLWSAYVEAHGAGAPGFPECARYAGLELLRRTIGAARVAAVGSDAASLAVLALATRLLREPPGAPAELAR